MDKAKKDGKPFFVWHNTTRMHVWTFLSKKYQAMMNSKTNYGLEEAGMAQMDDSIGALLKHLDDIGEADNTIVDLHHRQRRRSVHLAGRRHDAVQGHQGHGRTKAASACRASSAGRATSSRARSRTASSPASTGSRPCCAAAGNPNITDQLLKGVKLGDRTYKNHLDGYNQMDSARRARDRPQRHEFFYFGGPQLGAVRIDDFKFQFYQQPQGWPGPKVTTDMPTMVNIRQDPFERTPSIGGESLNNLRRRLHERLLRPRVLAVRPRAAGGGETRQDGHRLPADAGPGLLQPRRGQGQDRRDDPGAQRAVVEFRKRRAARQGCPRLHRGDDQITQRRHDIKWE